MFAYPSGAYASAEQSAVRDMYVDPNRLVLTLTLTLFIFMINVFVTWSKKFLRKWRRIQQKLPQSGVKTTQIRRFDCSSGVPIGRGEGYVYESRQHLETTNELIHKRRPLSYFKKRYTCICTLRKHEKEKKNESHKCIMQWAVIYIPLWDKSTYLECTKNTIFYNIYNLSKTTISVIMIFDVWLKTDEKHLIF